jgi:UDP-galactopyranose mutase
MIIMKKQEYDYLLVGAGLFNAIFAYEAFKDGKKCLVLEKRAHVGGNLHCENIADIIVHKYGPHIFHTKNKSIWEYMKQFCEFSNFVYRPLAFYKDELYNLPFNMNTFYQLWRTKRPKDAIDIISLQRLNLNNPCNFEEQALSLVGADIYNKLIKGYTEKQWGMDAKDLPAFIIKRLPLRFTFDNNYFNDPYQGIPIEGYNEIFNKCFQNSNVILNADFLCNRDIATKAKKVIYTGTIDQYYNYCLGQLEYRSLRFESELLNIPNYQGNAVINYTDRETPYTRILEHKHFEFNNRSDKTVITREYPLKWSIGEEPYYPINTDRNNELYMKYWEKSKEEGNVIFAGRLGAFSYYDMDQTVDRALSLYQQIKLE